MILENYAKAEKHDKTCMNSNDFAFHTVKHNDCSEKNTNKSKMTLSPSKKNEQLNINHPDVLLLVVFLIVFSGRKKNYEKNCLKGIDRIVPIGQALSIEFNWDGYELFNSMTRTISLR